MHIHTGGGGGKTNYFLSNKRIQSTKFHDNRHNDNNNIIKDN